MADHGSSRAFAPQGEREEGHLHLTIPAEERDKERKKGESILEGGRGKLT